MMWSSATDFFAMGGYGLFVWGSLGMCAAVVLTEVLMLKARRNAILRGASMNTEDNFL